MTRRGRRPIRASGGTTVGDVLVSAIVPVFNEGKTVAGVVAALLESPLIGQVICVDDGSTDDGPAVLESFGGDIVLASLGSNRGKGGALAEGLARSDGPIVAFFDADLTNLSEAHIGALLEPILAGQARAVLGYPNGLTPYLGALLARYTGERAYFRDDLLPHLGRIARSRFGVEVVLNGLIPATEIRVVPLEGLLGLDKVAKHGPPDALLEYWGEAVEISREMARQRIAAVRDHAIVNGLLAAIRPRPPRDS